MILAAGLSPAWQQIVSLDRLAVGEVNRARAAHWCASGKVLNVGQALCRLAGSAAPADGERRIEVETVATVGGPAGAAIQREFAALGIAARWIETEAPTRVCTTILDAASGRTTEFVENAGPVSADELARFGSTWREQVRRADVVVLTGSLPAGVPPTFYRDLLHGAAGLVVLDAQREPLLAALECRPFVVKPNREELANTLGRRIETDDELRAAMRELCRRGATWVVVSQGPERVWGASAQEVVSVQPPPVAVVNPIGSGDCLAAGIAVALARGADLPAAMLYGVAAATDNVGQLLPARIDAQRVAAQHRRMISSTAATISKLPESLP